MKYLLVCLVLAAASELGHGAEYTIRASRTSQIISSGYPVFYMYYQVSPKQNATFFKDITKENPFKIESYIVNENTGSDYSTDDNLRTCSDNDYSGWEYLLVSLVEMNILQGGCPVEVGSYLLDITVDPITVNFPDKIDCGAYTATFNLDRGVEWAAQLEYSFNIDESQDCNRK